MRTWVMFLALGLASVAGAVELEQATNDQLVGEVNRRLRAGPGPTGSSASYVCDSSGYLYIYLLGPDGKTASKYYSAGSQTACSTQANVLNRRKTRVDRVTVAAVCDSSGYLYRLALLPEGKFGDAPYNSVGSYDACVTQATSLNGGTHP